MIGTLDPREKKVTIVGGGISGLLMAEALDHRGYEVTLLERAPEVGGLIRTLETPYGIAETAAHSLLVSEDVAAVFNRLGVELSPIREDSRARFILRDGKMRKMPLNLWEILVTLARAYFVTADSTKSPVDISLAEWADRHLGRKARDYLFTPFVRGVYGAEPGDISLAAAFPALVVPKGHSLLSYQLAKAMGRGDRYPRAGLPVEALPASQRFGQNAGLPAPAKPRKGRKPMMAPAQGMGAVVRALETRLRSRLGDRFRTGQEIRALPRTTNLVLATSAPDAATLLEAEDPALARALREVRYTPMLSVTVFADLKSFAVTPRGVGVLVPAKENREILGVLFNSSSFPNRVKDESSIGSFTAMFGGTSRPEILERSDAEIRALVEREFRALFDSGVRIVDQRINRWQRAIPCYDATLVRAWGVARQGWASRPGRVLFGNYTGQVSLRGMIETTAAQA